MGSKNCFRFSTCAFASIVWLAAITTMGLYISTGTIMGGRHFLISLEHLQRFATRQRVLNDLGDAPQINNGRGDAQRRQLLEKENGKALTLELIHRNSPHSPIKRHYSSHLEELKEIIAADAKRLKAHQASILRRMQSNRSKDFSITGAKDGAKAPAVEPSPSPEPERHIDHARQPVKEKDFESPIISGSTLGNIGQYFVEFYIGTPGQRFLFIVDSGSDLIWVPCYPCSTCNNSFYGNIFFPKNSSTFSPISCSSDECNLVPAPLNATCNLPSPSTCEYEYLYGDLSETRGVFAYDTVTMHDSFGKSIQVENVAFGCGLKNTGSTFAKVGGVIGLGQGIVSFTSQIGYMYGNKFSYCFGDYFRSHSRSNFLVFGKTPAGKHLEETLQYTPFVSNALSETYYYVAIENVTVGEHHLPISSSAWDIDVNGNGGTVIDSGTTLSYFLEPTYQIILQAFDRAVSYPRAQPTATLDLCYNVSGIANPEFPKFSIRLRGNALFQPPVENYFLTPQDNVRCLSFLGNASPHGMSVLGNLLQQNFHIEYDRRNSRLGFARADCSAQA